MDFQQHSILSATAGASLCEGLTSGILKAVEVIVSVLNPVLGIINTIVSTVNTITGNGGGGMHRL